MDFTTAKKGDLEKLKQKNIEKINEDDFLAYYFASTKAGRNYMYNGHIPETKLILYGTLTKRLVKFPDGEWGVAQSNGVLPPFEKNPVLLNKEEFSEKMQEEGVPKDLIKEFFSFTPESAEYYA